MAANFDKIIINFIKTNITNKQKIDQNTLFTDIKEFDSLNFVKLIIYLNKYSVKVSSEKLSKIRKIKDLINVCKKN